MLENVAMQLNSQNPSPKKEKIYEFNSKLIHKGTILMLIKEGSITVPIYKTTAYQFNNTEHAASLFGLKSLVTSILD